VLEMMRLAKKITKPCHVKALQTYLIHLAKKGAPRIELFVIIEIDPKCDFSFKHVIQSRINIFLDDVTTWLDISESEIE
jgi:hypothetical protein